MALSNLKSVLILGADAVSAAAPATAVQLAHACLRWGFSAVVPASWGDELLSGHILQHCASRENKPAVVCACPRVAERFSAHGHLLDDALLWMTAPPVACAMYLKAIAAGEDVHVTYAGGCPGANDRAIDQRISPAELLLAISSRGIDVAAQPTAFEDVIPPDRRRHLSSAGGVPDPQLLWERSAFRVERIEDGNAPVALAQRLLSDDRVLIDLGPASGCSCRLASATDEVPLRSPSPVVSEGLVQVERSAPVRPVKTVEAPLAKHREVDVEPETPPLPLHRLSPARPLVRRASTWRRQTPRPGGLVSRQSGAMVAVIPRAPLLQRPEVRVAIAAAIIVATLLVGVWLGRRSDRPVNPPTGSVSVLPSTPSVRSRSR